MYRVTKTYDHNLGLSACFRQWRATSHCRFLHGYPLSFKLTFEAEELNENNWVFDFGGLKPVKAWLVENFDHRLLVAEDDPELPRLCALHGHGPDGQHQLADVLVLPAVGCEAVAKYVYDFVDQWLLSRGHKPRVHLCEVEVREHAGNSASYMGGK
jgi:6-pyruvoyltetrahydropterin/6-carboxytetrahydropterin synthase